MKLLILVGIIFLALIVLAIVVVWYVFIFSLIALGVLAGLTFWVTYAIVESISNDPVTGQVAGVMLTLLMVGGALYFFSRSRTGAPGKGS